jgi:hypothetical protein
MDMGRVHDHTILVPFLGRAWREAPKQRCSFGLTPILDDHAALLSGHRSEYCS